mmetsp:Transcript_31764/g.66308  ORF Transcript_31764/g.66308 Transcript_31764/m.66308 type:complete len:528 (+) Transcript_31764:211-1794(+)
MSASTSIYDQCLAAYFETNDAASADDSSLEATLARQQYLLKCISESNAESINTFFLVYASSLVFFMQAGFAMLCAGSVQKKNVQNTMLKNLLDACGAAIGFYSVGYAFAYGGSEDCFKTGCEKTFIGLSNFFLSGVVNHIFWLFQFAFAATSATIVAGTLAERCQMRAYMCYSFALTGFVYPVVVHSIWSPQGFLSANSTDKLWGVGMVDFAGSTVVHLTGGCTALIATYLLGPRRGRFYDGRGKQLETPNPMPGHSSALQMLGAFILWFGWYGFNLGSALRITGPDQNKIVSIAAVNTTLCAAASCFAALFSNYVLVERETGEGEFNLTCAMNGCLAGLVAITAGCAVVDPWASLVIGVLAGILFLFSSRALVRFRIDDAVDAVPVHMSNGVWGGIAVGLFATKSRLEQVYGEVSDQGVFMGGNGTLLGVQFCGILFVIGWVTTFMFPFFCILNYLGWFRCDVLNEIAGLDLSYHGAKYGDVDSIDKILEAQARIQQRGRTNPRHRFSSNSGSTPVRVTNSSDPPV